MMPKENNTRRYFSAYNYGQNAAGALASDLVLRMLEQAVYATQYRLKEVDHIIKKYENDPRFRLAYAFKQLEEWEHELQVMYSWMSNSTWPRSSIWWFRVYHVAVYYTHGAKRMIDVTYTKDHIIDLATSIIESRNDDDIGNQ